MIVLVINRQLPSTINSVSMLYLDLHLLSPIFRTLHVMYSE